MEEKNDSNLVLIQNENENEKKKDNNEENKSQCCVQEEEQILLKKKFDINKENIEEKGKLQKVLKNIEIELCKDLEKEKEKINNKEDENKEKEEEKKDPDIVICFKNQRYKCLLFCIFSVFLPFFIVINLIGIFQIISVMNTLYVVIKRSIICYLDLEDKDDSSYYDFYTNFYGFYFKESMDEGIDYDLIETMSFLGTIFIRFYGFSISSVFFMVLNIISLFLILNFFSEYFEIFEKYTILEIVYLIICYILLFVGVGSSALLSQQLLIDNYEKYSIFYYEHLSPKNEDEKEEEKKDEKITEPYFILVCVTSIIGFLFKYFFDIIISYKKHAFDENIKEEYNPDPSMENYNITITKMNTEIFEHDRFLFYFIITIYGGAIILSIILYRVFKLVYEGDEVKKKNKNKNKGERECNFFGYIIYLKKDNKKKRIDELDDIDDDDNDDDIKNNIDISINDEKESMAPKKNFVTEIVGGKRRNPSIAQEERNMWQRTLDYLKTVILKLYLCLRLLSDSFISWFNEIICNYFCCGKKCCCCCICFECCSKKVKEEEYELEESYICYCYKAKRNMKWFNRFIRDETQMKIMPLLLQYFIIQLNTVAFEKIFDENNEEGLNEFNDTESIIYFIVIFAVSLFLFFYITISFGNLLTFYSKKREDKLNVDVKVEIGKSAEKISNNILQGTYGILIFNGFYSFIVSIFCLMKNVKNNYIFYVPILINKFYYFTFAHQCTIYTDNDDEINYFTIATLLSIYLQIWDFFLDLLKKIPTKGLLLFQLILSTGIILISLFILVILLFFIKKFFFTLLFFISFLFSFGGFWFVYCYEKFGWEAHECSKFDNEEKLKEMYIGKETLEKLKKKLLAN